MSEVMQVVLAATKVGTIGTELPVVRLVAKVFEFLPLPRAVTPLAFTPRNKLKKYSAANAASAKKSESANTIFSNVAAEAEKGEKLDEDDVKVEATTFGRFL